MSKKLESDLLKHLKAHLKSNGYNSDHTDAVKDYTESSVSLNVPRLHGLPTTQSDIDKHNRLIETAFGSPNTFHVYTGSHVDLGELARTSKDGVLHLPAHLSTSLCDHIASGFGNHMSKIHIKPNDKILPAFGHGLHENEKEVILPAGTRIKHINPLESKQGHTPEFEIHSVQHPTHEELQGSNKNVETFLSKLTPSKPKEAHAATEYLSHKYPKTDAFKTATTGELSTFKDSLVNFQKIHGHDSGEHIKVHQALMTHPRYDFDNAIHGKQSEALVGALLSSDEALKKMGKDTQKDILTEHPHLSYLSLPKKNLHPDNYDEMVDRIAQTGRYAQSAIMSPHMKPHHITKIVQKLTLGDMRFIPGDEKFGKVLSSSSPKQKADAAERFYDYGEDKNFKTPFSVNPLDRLLSSKHFGTSKDHLDILRTTDRDTLRAHILHNSPHINDIAANHQEVLKRTDDLSLNPHLSKKTQDKVLEHVMHDANGNHDLFIRSLPKEKHSEFLSNPATPQHIVDSTLRSTTPEEWSGVNHSRAMKLASNGDLDIQKRILRDRTHHVKSVTSKYLLDIHNKTTNDSHLRHDIYSHPSLSAEDLHKVLDDFSGSHANNKNNILYDLVQNPNLQPSHIDRITNGSGSELTDHLYHPNATGDNVVKYITRGRAMLSPPKLYAVTENIDKLSPENVGTLLNHASKKKLGGLAREVLKSKNVPGDVLAAIAHNTDFSSVVAEHPNTPASVLHSFANDQHKRADIRAMANMRLGHRADAHQPGPDHNFLKNVLKYGAVTESDKEKIIVYGKHRNDSSQELASHPAFSSDMIHDAIRRGIDLSNIRNNPNLTPEHTETAFTNLHSNADIFNHLPPGNHLKKFQGTSDEWRSISENPHLKADHIEQLHKDQEFLHPDVFSHTSMPLKLKRNVIDNFKKDGNENAEVRAVYTDKALPSSELEAVSKLHRPAGDKLTTMLMATLSSHPNVNPRTIHNLVRFGSNHWSDRLSEKAHKLKIYKTLSDDIR